jgi:DNA-binding Lrp family transcriptional regulator
MEGDAVSRSLKVNEKKILKLLIENKDLSFREIARLVELNEVSVRRLHNKLKQEEVFYTLHIPNFPALGYKIMMVQRIYIASPFLIETRNICKRIQDEWSNCIDCHETYDGKILARSIWRNAEEFKRAHADFYKKFGTDWLQREHIDMVPLDHSSRLVRINGISF